MANALAKSYPMTLFFIVLVHPPVFCVCDSIVLVEAHTTHRVYCATKLYRMNWVFYFNGLSLHMFLKIQHTGYVSAYVDVGQRMAFLFGHALMKTLILYTKVDGHFLKRS